MSASCGPYVDQKKYFFLFFFHFICQIPGSGKCKNVALICHTCIVTLKVDISSHYA